MKERRIMGTVYTDITLKNAGDKIRVECGLIKEPEIRETTVRAMVDTGAITLVINEAICQHLGLDIQAVSEATLGNDTKAKCKLTSPVEVHWRDRSAVCQALVTSEKGEVLFGAIPLECMDLMVNPVNQELVGAHGDKIVYLVK
jgi:clan AA aspartic protease